MLQTVPARQMQQLFSEPMEVITEDLFGIAGRLMSVDPRYRLYRNRKMERFELWWEGRLSLVLPFETLDERTVEYARKTRRENADEIMDEIAKGNEAVERQKQKNLEIMQAQIRDCVKYEYQRYY